MHGEWCSAVFLRMRRCCKQAIWNKLYCTWEARPRQRMRWCTWQTLGKSKAALSGAGTPLWLRNICQTQIIYSMFTCMLSCANALRPLKQRRDYQPAQHSCQVYLLLTNRTFSKVFKVLRVDTLLRDSYHKQNTVTKSKEKMPMGMCRAIVIFTYSEGAGHDFAEL